MKKKLFFIVLWGSFMITNPSIAQSNEIRIKVTDIHIKKGGNIIVMIFGKTGFPKVHTQALSTQVKQATDESLTFNFSLNINELAIKVLHDENGDGQVSKNWTGIFPREGLGFSNDQKISLTGPPNYKNSKLTKAELINEIVIPVRYP